MAKSVFRTVLVIGDNHEELIKKYSADTKVEEHVKCRLDDAEHLHKSFLKLIETILESKDLNISENQRDNYKKLYLNIKEMSDFEYYQYYTKGCRYDEETGDALTDENPNAHYRAERCYENRLRNHNEEGPFSNPFWLNDATKSYSARFNDICWKRIHMYDKETEIYKRAWELVVDDDEPKDEKEERIKANMIGKLGYFLNFKDKDEYIRHSCSFWCYGVITENGYDEVTYQISDKDWVANFYDKYIKNIKGNPLLTIYEVRSLND